MAVSTMAEKIWDLANLVTAFSVAQSLGTIFAVLKGDLVGWLVDKKAHMRALCGVVVFVILYTSVIIWCGLHGIVIDSENSDIWCTSTIGRGIAIIVFNVILVLVFIGHHLNMPKLVR